MRPHVGRIDGHTAQTQPIKGSNTMAILINVKYHGATDHSGAKYGGTIADTFGERKFRAYSSAYDYSQLDGYQIAGDKPREHYTDSQICALNAAYKALRKWVDTTELEAGRYPVTGWTLQYIGEDHRREDIIQARPIYAEDSE